MQAGAWKPLDVMQLAALSELEPSVVRPGPAVLKNLLGASYL